MTDALWSRLADVVPEALDLPPSDREAFLDRACAAHDGTGALRREAAALVAASDAADTTGALVSPLAGFASDTEGTATVPERLGPWQLLGRLGAGGMGVVYRARRADGRYERDVALKAVRHASPDLARRFAAECRALARLEHPHVARLYDAGVADDGPLGTTPWLAMEIVDGEPITAYADRHALGVDARLGLVLQACEAVAYAHGRLIVHRDLKPSNILVAEAPGGPRAVVLDFGIARLLGDPADVLTRTGDRVLTPAYAAPEQLSGGEVTTATDVYGLGALLYELLVGRRPYDLADLTAAGTERAKARPPAPPSAALAERAHSGQDVPGRALSGRALRGDLDTICLKALAPEPERRYESAQALADDLRRHLDGLPIRARTATAAYRASRFVRRHRAGVASAAAAVATVAALVGFYTVRLTAERDRAQRATVTARAETEQAEAVAGFLEQIIRAPSTRWYVEGQAKGPETPIRAVLDEAAARVDRDFAQRPALRADLHHILGDTYMALGLGDEARRHHEAVLALRERLYRPPHPELAEATFYAAMVQRDRAEYVRMMRRALAMQRQRPEGNNFPFMVESLGNSALTAGRTAEADALVSEGIEFADARFVSGHDGYRYRDRILTNLAAMRVRVRLAQRDADGTERALAALDSLVAHPPGVPQDYGQWRSEACARGELLLMRHRPAEAERALLACAGAARAPALQPPMPRPRPAASDDLLQGRAGVLLASLYAGEGRPAATAPFRAPAARYLAYRDTARLAFRRADRGGRTAGRPARISRAPGLP